MARLTPSLRLFLLLFLLCAAIPRVSAVDGVRRRFNLPADAAEHTLRLFATQSGLEVLFSRTSTAGVRTNALQGEYPPVDAVTQLLAGSVLEAAQDPATGALVVSRRRSTELAAPKDAPVSLTQPKLEENPMKTSRTFIAVLAGWLAPLTATEAPTAYPAPKENAVVLSPFQVNTSRDSGYVASSTLAGTRLNSEIWDTPAAISVFTSEFLSDLGILDVKSSLNFALNASEDTSNYTGNFLVANDVNIQIRGFIDAAVGRNYFTWRLSSDVFNVERIDFSRGPNSVLFGVGAPGGIVNTSSKRAIIGQDLNLLRTRIGSWDDHRVEYDFSRTLLKDKLAVRANLLWHDKNDCASSRPRNVARARSPPRIGLLKAQKFASMANTGTSISYTPSLIPRGRGSSVGRPPVGSLPTPTARRSTARRPTRLPRQSGIRFPGALQ